MVAVLRTLEGARGAPVSGVRGEPEVRLKPLKQRQRVRFLAVPDLSDRPARARVVGWMKDDQLRLNVTQDEYAVHLGVSPSTLSRFRTGTGKLSKQMRRRLVLLHPRWKRTLDDVVLEDLRQDDAAAGPG